MSDDVLKISIYCWVFPQTNKKQINKIRTRNYDWEGLATLFLIFFILRYLFIWRNFSFQILIVNKWFKVRVSFAFSLSIRSFCHQNISKMFTTSNSCYFWSLFFFIMFGRDFQYLFTAYNLLHLSCQCFLSRILMAHTMYQNTSSESNQTSFQSTKSRFS